MINSINDIRDGDIVLESGGSIIADEIQWFQNCEWNHALRVFWVRGRLYAYEAMERGPVATPFQDHIVDYNSKNKKAIVLRPVVPYSEDERDIMFHFVNPLCGKARYGYWNLVVLQGVKYGWKKAFGKELWLGNSKKYHNNRFYICGQLVARQEYLIRKNIEWEDAAPVDLFNLEGYEKIIINSTI